MSFSIPSKDNTACSYTHPTIQNHPSPTPGAKINSGYGMRGSRAGDRTNLQPITRKPRSGNDSKTYRTYAGGENL